MRQYHGDPQFIPFERSDCLTHSATGELRKEVEVPVATHVCGGAHGSMAKKRRHAATAGSVC